MVHRVILSACVLAVACLSQAQADEVTFKNGDRLSGKVLSLVEGKLTIESAVAGKVTVDMADVATLSTEEPVALHLSDGSVARQTLVAGDPGQVGIPGEGALEAQTFPIAQVAAINPPPPPPEPKPKWKGSITAGYTVTTGNTETESRSLDLDLKRRGENDRITLGAGYYYGEQEDPATGADNVTQDEWFAGGQYDYFVGEKMYVYGSGRFEHDEVALLDGRTTLGTGLGYQWVEREDLAFGTEAGIAYLHEEFDDAAQTTNDEMSAQAAYHFMAKLASNATFLHDLTYVPAWNDFGDYYLTTSAQVRVDMTEVLFSSFKIVLDYDATPAPGQEKTDTKYMLGVGLNF
jgi:putative salt-induced outer membrane protein YdiY